MSIDIDYWRLVHDSESLMIYCLQVRELGTPKSKGLRSGRGWMGYGLVRTQGPKTNSNDFLFFLSLKKKKVNKLNCQQCGRAGEQDGHNQATLWKQKWVTEGICDCKIQTMLKEIKLTTITGLGRGLWRYHGHDTRGSAYPGQQSQTAASC